MTAPSLKCVGPAFDDKCFDVLSLNPCRQETTFRYALPSAVVLWISLLLLLFQSIRTARSIINRLPKTNTFSLSSPTSWHSIRCFQQYPDFRVCVLACCACLFSIISSIAHCFTWYYATAVTAHSCREKV